MNNPQMKIQASNRTCHVVLTVFFLLAVSIGGVLIAGGVFAQDKGKDNKPSLEQRDPFVPLISPAGYLLMPDESREDSEFHLGGVMVDPGGESVAIIDGEIVRVGDSFKNGVIVSIDEDKVVLVKDNQKVELAVREEEK